MDRLVARNALVVTCAASAGVHAALVPEHLKENAVLGGGFAVAAVCLFASAATFARARAADRLAAPATGVLLIGLIVAYVVSRTVGLPVGDGEVEAVDAFGVTTQIAQLVGLAAAVLLSRPYEERKFSNETRSAFTRT
jgi:hypothetical protein